MKAFYLIILLLLSSQLSYASVDEKVDVKIGVLAKRGAETTLIKWEPTAHYLNNKYHEYNFIIVPMNFDEIPMLVSNSLVDFVIVNSAIYVDLSVKYGVNRIATLRNHLIVTSDITKFGSVIFVKKGSLVESLRDMENRKVAAVHETSLGGWLMALRELKDKEISIDQVDVNFLDTQDAVVMSVLEEVYEIGIVRTDTLERMAYENKISLEDIKVINNIKYKEFPFLASTRLYPEWPIAKLPNTNVEIAKKVVIALMLMESNSTAAFASKIDGWSTPEDYSSVHDLLKRLNISPYEEYGKITLISVLQQYWAWLILLTISIGGLIMITIYSLRLNKSLKNEQKNLIKNEERFRATFDQAGIGIVHLTFEGAFIRVNQQFCKLVKYSCIEVYRLNFSDLIHPLDLSKIVQSIQKLKNSNISNCELTIRLNDFNSDLTWVVITLSKVTESEDSDDYLVATIVDISEIKELEVKMEREKVQKELILDMAGDGILGLDIDAKHTFVNSAAARLLGYEVDEMIGKDSHKMWHHTKEDGVAYLSEECPITSVLKNGITHRGHNELFWKKDNKALIVDFISTPIKESNKIVGTVVIFRESNPALGTVEL